ncbi:MAG: PD-(D/E)XK nuclease family protein, partial [Bacteroidia bacterium]|nr:PD-(D/E)XK nuclease family protein [Bacteroidia bacterium]
FAGFYALTKTEEVILEHFIVNHGAKIFWDADSFYVDQKYQEAGTFFRKGKLASTDFKWKMNHFADREKTIEITGVPLLVGQARYAGELLSSMMDDPEFKPERTAVVLPDEKLLFPMLYSLPEKLMDINVTMGYPLRVTPLYNLFEALVGFRKNQRREKDAGRSFYYRDTMAVLNHPYIRLLAPLEIQKWISNYNRTRSIRIREDQFTGSVPAVFKLIFSDLSGMQEIFKWFREILQMILAAMKQENFKFHSLESEFVVQFYTQLSRLEDALVAEDLNVELDTSWFLFREIIQSVKIPFTGEPLNGLQVMGFLETRVLDFDRVILLSVNEDVLPASGNKPSFIPFNIRKAFGLPTFEDQHAVSAYHFYRLLQRAEKIHLIYNTESKAIAGGEMSRFLLQIEHELVPAFSGKIKLTRKVLSTSFAKESIEPIVIQKTLEVLASIEKYGQKKIGIDSESKVLSFSPSALNTYINCPLKFYFRYLAGLKEPDETQEFMEAAGFGSILHRTMHLLYDGHTDLLESTVNSKKALVDSMLDQAIQEVLLTDKQLEGKNLLLRNVLKELIGKILKADSADTPILLHALEKKVFRSLEIDNGIKVQLHGIVDRIDEHQNVIRILDYKTGNVTKRKLKEVSDLFIDPVFKEQFQAMLYAYIVRQDNPGKNIKAGLVTLRDMSKGIWYLNDGEPYSDETLIEFESGVKKILNEIFDPATPFLQTIDEKRCNYCAYAGICHRETKGN